MEQNAQPINKKNPHKFDLNKPCEEQLVQEQVEKNLELIRSNCKAREESRLEMLKILLPSYFEV